MADILEPAAKRLAQSQCQFFVLRKKRLCRMTVRPGRQYCGEHEPEPKIEDGVTDQRVPCPNDPKHTCYMSKLEKHLIKCNARKGEEPPFIMENINAPTDVVCPPRLPLRDIPEVTLLRVIEKVNKLYNEHLKDKISSYTPKEEHHPAVVEELSEPGRSASSLRHLRQASRLLQLAEDEDLEKRDTCYVELGAGKGMLSYYMGRAWCEADAEGEGEGDAEGEGEGDSGGGSTVVVVDRAALRHKRDNCLLPERRCRVRADLRHLALAAVPAVAAAKRLAGLAKHLCGVATDYALRCLTAEELLPKCRGALIATCCHHRCELAAYVGDIHLQALGITQQELNIIFSIVSWATCGDGRSREVRNAPPPPPLPLSSNKADYTFKRITDEGTYDLNSPRDTEHSRMMTSPRDFTQEYREGIGRRAKALVDYGRVLYLTEKGFRVKLCYYVPTTESLENVCIVAKKEVL